MWRGATAVVNADNNHCDCANNTFLRTGRTLQSAEMDAREPSPRSEQAAGGSRSGWVYLSVVVILATALRLHDLAAKSFWHDEGFSAELARLPLSGFARLLWAREANMGLYYVLLREWMHFGTSEGWVRGLSVVFGVAVVPLLYALGTAVSTGRAGLTAATLGAVNACSVAYSQEARGYSLAMFLVTLSMFYFAKHVESGGRRYGLAWAVASALAVYCHFYAGLVVGAECASLLLVRPAEFSFRDGFRAFRTFVYLLVPAIAFVLTHGAGALSWLPRPAPKSVLELFLLFSGNSGPWLLALYACACALSLWATWRVARENGRSIELWRRASPWLWLLLPIALCLVVSLWHPVFLIRYLLVCLPALVLAAAMGLEQLRRGPLVAAAVLAIVLLSSGGLRAYYAGDFILSGDDWRDATRALLVSAQPGDAVLFYVPTGRMSYEYYRSLDGNAAGPDVLYPSHVPGRLDYRDFIVEPLGESLQGVRLDAPRIWLVFVYAETPSGPDPTGVLLRNWCEARYRRVLDDRKFPGIELLLLGK